MLSWRIKWYHRNYGTIIIDPILDTSSALCSVRPSVRLSVSKEQQEVNLHSKYQGCRSNGSGVRPFTDGWTDECYQVHYLSALLNYAVDKHQPSKFNQDRTDGG